ncbi:unnamed protein product, partial [Iphiclides podalirius]
MADRFSRRFRAAAAPAPGARHQMVAPSLVIFGCNEQMARRAPCLFPDKRDSPLPIPAGRASSEAPMDVDKRYT